MAGGQTSPLTWAVRQLNTHGLVAVSRHVLAQPPNQAERYPGFEGGNDQQLGVAALAGGLAMLEVILLAGSAFAVTARRRRRDLALVAAAGATPAQLRRIVLADGVVLGTVAAVSGVALGIAAAAASRPLLERLSSIRTGAFRVFPEALAALAAVAVVTGVLAALVPPGSPPARTWSPPWPAGAASPGRGGAGWCSARCWWAAERLWWPPAPGAPPRPSSWLGWSWSSWAWCRARPRSSGWWPGWVACCRWRRGSRCATPPATARPRPRRSRR